MLPRLPTRRSPPRHAIALTLGIAILTGCDAGPAEVDPPGTPPPPGLVEGTELYGFRVVDQHPHDSTAFTQGLVLVDGALYEGTGRFGRSGLRRVDRETGRTVREVTLPDDLFGEGIAVVGDRVVQLTWKAQRGFVYDRASFELRREFAYTGEGWGLAFDGARLVMSDGTPTLRFLDPETLEVERTITVHHQGRTVSRLNELEVIDGYVFANVWKTDRIAVIEAATGAIISWVDLTGLLPPAHRSSADVLNGIAFDRDSGHLLVTGKLWPLLFEIVLVPRDG